MNQIAPPHTRGTLVKEAPVHWLRGGSVANRIVACPGYPNLAAQYPPDPAGEPAIEGTHDHTLLETAIKHGVWEASEYLGQRLTDHAGDFVVDRLRADRVQMALDYVADRLRELPAETAVLSEAFLNAGRPYGVPDWGGSADLCFVYPGGWEVVEYKGGFALVEPTSAQLQTYAIGLVNQHTGLIGAPGRKTILQPRRFAQARYVDVTYREFERETASLVHAMRMSMHPDAPRIPGDHCRYCRGARSGRCPEWNAQRDRNNQKAMTTMNTMIANQTVGGGHTPAPGSTLQIESIGPHTSIEQLQRLLDAEPIITEMIKEAKAEALKRAISGQTFPGRKLIREKAREGWIEGAAERIEEAKILPKKAIYKDQLRTPKQLRETEEYNKLGPKRRAAVEELVKSGGEVYRLVLESDRGKPVTPGLTAEQLTAAADTKPALPPAAAPEPVTHTPISFF